MPGVGEDRTPFEQRRVTVAEAGDALGISAEAVRMRVRRGTLRSEHVEGTVYVLLDADQTQHVADTSTDRTDILIAELQDRVRSLEEANRENRRLLAAALERIPPQLEAASERSVEGSERPDEPRSSTGGPGGPGYAEKPFTDEEATEPQGTPRSKVPWWRKWFGG
jgi:hypothetical protein